MGGPIVIQKGTARHTNVTVGTSATLMLAANNIRKSATFQNQSANTVYLGGDATVASSGANTGYALAAGATLTDTGTSGAWYGLASGASPVHIVEVV